MTTPEAEQPPSEPQSEPPSESSAERFGDDSRAAEPTDGPSSGPAADPVVEDGAGPSGDAAGAEGATAAADGSDAEPAAESAAEPAAESAAGPAAGPAAESGDEGGERPEARLERAVRAAEQALIEFEIAVETFRIEVENFSRLHHQRLGPMYSRLDELDAQIAEARAASTGDPEDVRKAQEARARVMPMPGIEELFHNWLDSDGLSPEASAMLTEQPVRPPERVRPSDEARKLYRELVRKAHPDLAQDDTERARRDEFIARVNAAYARGDVALLRELSGEWAAGPVSEEWRPSRSEELYARLEWLAQRKELLALVARELEESAIGGMLKIAPDDPDKLLEEVAEQLLAQVSEREAELAGLLGSEA
ncbi:hypothetical protein QFZ75_003941 [Streptomyces sp. V3I8]|uniref:J domain-containing protein n=1 Tax=Streptomyces sp. V3I8 TaxID=3042279 RepID=UPI00278A6F85|nr:J domain-containing protein [Streptomyces sp. V3I8]MDQ1037525.1 hypothetical protein [Streptomyces sp. V3I8]